MTCWPAWSPSATASTVISRNERYRWGRRNRRAEFLKLISHVYLFIKLRGTRHPVFQEINYQGSPGGSLYATVMEAFCHLPRHTLASCRRRWAVTWLYSGRPCSPGFM